MHPLGHPVVVVVLERLTEHSLITAFQDVWWYYKIGLTIGLTQQRIVYRMSCEIFG